MGECLSIGKRDLRWDLGVGGVLVYVDLIEGLSRGFGIVWSHDSMMKLFTFQSTRLVGGLRDVVSESQAGVRRNLKFCYLR